MSFTEFVESPGYKKVMAKVYGLGAAVVILGALWKILHLPGASIMLIAGLGTEAIIFGLSAFEPPHEMPDWSLVYPELVGLEPNTSRHGGGGGSELAALIQTGNIDAADVQKLSDGIKKLSSTSSQIADISNATVATENYVQNIKQAGNSVGEFASAQSRSAKSLDESINRLSSSYSDAANSISASGREVANSYAAVSSSLKEQVDKFKETNSNYSIKMAEATQNVSALNSAYELQLQGINSQIQSAKSLSSGMSNVSELFQQSANDAQVYRQQIELLSKNVSELNSIYGNMLSAMNVGKR